MSCEKVKGQEGVLWRGGERGGDIQHRDKLTTVLGIGQKIPYFADGF